MRGYFASSSPFLALATVCNDQIDMLILQSTAMDDSAEKERERERQKWIVNQQSISKRGGREINLRWPSERDVTSFEPFQFARLTNNREKERETLHLYIYI